MSESDSNNDAPHSTSKETPPPPPKTKTAPARTNPPTLDMVNDAIKELCITERKGATIQGIKRLITSKYEINQDRLKLQMKAALKKGLDSGQFMRPKNFEGATGVMTGRYKLGKPPKPKAVKASEKVKAKKKAAQKVKKAQTDEDETNEDYKNVDKEKTPPTKRRAPSNKTNAEKAPRRAHSLSPKVKKSKSKLRRSISLTPGKAVTKVAKTEKQTKKDTKKDAMKKEKEPKGATGTKQKAAKSSKLDKENVSPEAEEEEDKKPKKKEAGKKKKKAAVK